MMMRRIGVAIGCIGAVVTGTGCGPEPVAQEELEEVCGQTGPVRILPLEPDRQVHYGWPTRTGDRLVFVTERIELVEERDQTYPRASEPEVWSTGLCGESPVLIARGIQDVFTRDRWPEVLLGCDPERAAIVSLDPLGQREPHVVFAGDPEVFGCSMNWTEHGVLSLVRKDENFGALMLSPYPEDPLTQTAEPEVLLDDVRFNGADESSPGIVAGSIQMFPDFVLALDSEGTLMRADLVDREVVPLQENVRSLDTSFDGRWLLWQDSTITREDPRFPEGDIFLRDLSTGTETLLLQASLEFSIFPLSMVGAGVVQIGLSYINYDVPKRIYFLPELDFVEAPADLLLNEKIDEERWLGGSVFSSYLEVLDLRAGTSRRLFDRPARIQWFEDDALVMFEAKTCCIEGSFRDEGPLWRVPYDGAPKQLAKRVTDFMRRISDDRVLGPVAVGDDWLGDLVVVDLSTGEERLVDRHVFATSLDTRWGEADGLISYSIADGERSGVYVARLPMEGRSGSRKQVREHLGFDVVHGADGRPMPVPRLRPGVPDWKALMAARDAK